MRTLRRCVHPLSICSRLSAITSGALQTDSAQTSYTGVSPGRIYEILVSGNSESIDLCGVLLNRREQYSYMAIPELHVSSVVSADNGGVCENEDAPDTGAHPSLHVPGHPVQRASRHLEEIDELGFIYSMGD